MLDLLSPVHRASLLGRLEAIALPVGAKIYDPGETPRYAHFMTSGVTSIVTFMTDGMGVETGLIGCEGLVEAFHLLGPANLPTTGFVQVEATALRMGFQQLRDEFHSIETLRRLVLQSIQGQSQIVSQIAACNRLHEVDERLARWLLMVRDRVGRSEFHLTQEFIAEMLGAQRTTVTLAAGVLQRKKLIEYSRGHLRLLDPAGLEAAACECYPIVRDLHFNMYRERVSGVVMAGQA